jgi:hypothetical protein
VQKKRSLPQVMSTSPSIILTRLDVQRLEQLIDRLDDTRCQALSPCKPNLIVLKTWSVTKKCLPTS